MRFWSLPDGRQQGAPLRFPYGNADVAAQPGRPLAERRAAQSRHRAGPAGGLGRPRAAGASQTLRPAGGAGTARFSPDGRLLAVGDLRGRVQVLLDGDLEAGHAVARAAAGPAGWRSAPTAARSPPGTTDGTVRLWDIATRQALGAPLPGVPNSAAVPIVHAGRHAPDRRATTTGARTAGTSGPQSLARQACEVAGRRLTRAEWEEFLPGRDYDPAC